MSNISGHPAAVLAGAETKFSLKTDVMMTANNAPIIVNPHLPQVGQRVGICSDLSAYFVPRVGAFVQEFSLFF